VPSGEAPVGGGEGHDGRLEGLARRRRGEKNKKADSLVTDPHEDPQPQETGRELEWGVQTGHRVEKKLQRIDGA